MSIDRRIIWLLVVVVLLIVLALALDHVFFPDLPIPAGAPSIIK